MAQVVTAPATVMTEDGKVWTVRNDRLILEDIELLSERHQEIRFRFAREPDENRQVVRYPLSVMLEGQKVSPIAANDQGGN